jgi:predicted DCC family thiol-disulfide oxidoreductase YuxK
MNHSPALLQPAARVAPERGPLLLFDGVCNFCNATVRFVLARERDASLRFAPLQSEAARGVLREAGLPEDRLDTVVLIDEAGAVWTSSAALLMIVRRLSGAWPWLSVLAIVPARVRDALYRAFVRRRYRWFGRSEACPLPPPEVRARFLA